MVLYLNLQVFKPGGFKLLFSLSVNLTIIFSFGLKTASAALQFSTHRDIFSSSTTVCCLLHTAPLKKIFFLISMGLPWLNKG